MRSSIGVQQKKKTTPRLECVLYAVRSRKLELLRLKITPVPFTISKPGITTGLFRVGPTVTAQGAECQESRIAVDGPSHFPRSRLFFAALLAVSLIGSVHLISQSKAVASEHSISAGTATGSTYDRVQTGVPRIVTWRPLPVATPVLHRRPRAAPTPKPQSGDEG